jgi:hypothetical protein
MTWTVVRVRYDIRTKDLEGDPFWECGSHGQTWEPNFHKKKKTPFEVLVTQYKRFDRIYKSCDSFENERMHISIRETVCVRCPSHTLKNKRSLPHSLMFRSTRDLTPKVRP